KKIRTSEVLAPRQGANLVATRARLSYDPGRVPHFLREAVMINFERFWMEGDDPYMTPGETGPALTPDAIPAWEQVHGVTLPEPIRTALGLRNGGVVRNTPFQILPLEQIVPVDDDFWTFTEIEDDEAPDHGLMFVCGYELQTGATILMNFNAQGPEGPP